MAAQHSQAVRHGKSKRANRRKIPTDPDAKYPKVFVGNLPKPVRRASLRERLGRLFPTLKFHHIVVLDKLSSEGKRCALLWTETLADAEELISGCNGVSLFPEFEEEPENEALGGGKTVARMTNVPTPTGPCPAHLESVVKCNISAFVRNCRKVVSVEEPAPDATGGPATAPEEQDSYASNLLCFYNLPAKGTSANAAAEIVFSPFGPITTLSSSSEQVGLDFWCCKGVVRFVNADDARRCRDTLDGLMIEHRVISLWFPQHPSPRRCSVESGSSIGASRSSSSVGSTSPRSSFESPSM